MPHFAWNPCTMLKYFSKNKDGKSKYSWKWVKKKKKAQLHIDQDIPWKHWLSLDEEHQWPTLIKREKLKPNVHQTHITSQLHKVNIKIRNWTKKIMIIKILFLKSHNSKSAKKKKWFSIQIGSENTKQQRFDNTNSSIPIWLEFQINC